MNLMVEVVKVVRIISMKFIHKSSEQTCLVRLNFIPSIFNTICERMSFFNLVILLHHHLHRRRSSINLYFVHLHRLNKFIGKSSIIRLHSTGKKNSNRKIANGKVYRFIIKINSINSKFIPVRLMKKTND